jgi:hypothetical protein
MFLQDSAGTGKTFTVKALISALQTHRKMCLICATTGIAAVQTHEIQDWRELQRCFHVFVTKDIGAAHDFFCDGLEPRDPFPLDHQWIYATNKLVNQPSFAMMENPGGSVIRHRICFH